MTPALSFIVPAHNEESIIAETLRAIHATARDAGETYEIIVVDDASTDGTTRIARHEGAMALSINRRHIAAARNAGAAAASGDLLLFVDADTTVNAASVQAAVRSIRAGAVGGGARLRFDHPMPAYGRAVIRPFLWIYARLGLAAGCFLFSTRKAFVAVGGFDERLYASEEISLSRRLARHGQFVILEERVVTSSRKFRTHTAREMLWTFVRVLITGPWMVKRRERLSLWYGPRRHDPRTGS